MSNTENNKNGPSALFILFCIFLVLKLCHVITWSWWLVCLPIYIGLAFVLAITVSGAILALLGAGVAVLLDSGRRRRQARRKRKANADQLAAVRKASYSKTYSKSEW